MNKNITLLLTVVISLMIVAGQYLWKLGASQREIRGLNDILTILTSPTVILGLIVYFFATIIWIYVLSKAELTYIYTIMQGMTFILTFIIGLVFLKENISITRWIGTSLVCIGILIQLK